MEYVLEDSNAADYFNKHVVGFSFTDDPDNSANMDTTLWYSNAVSWLHCLLDCFFLLDSSWGSEWGYLDNTKHLVF